ncbi:MAG: PIN domain-containing protein [Candidatus Bathyarchaeia archaeon]
MDANIILELLLGRGKAKECEELLNKISKGKVEAIMTHFTVHAIESIMNDKELILKFLRNLESSVGLYVYDTDISDETAAAILMEDIKRDFDDALQYYVAKKLGVKAIVSFDKHFDGLDTPRLEPKDVNESLSEANH